MHAGATLISFVNPFHGKLSLGNKNVSTIHIIPSHWNKTGSCSPPSIKTRTYLFCKVNIMGADVLATQGASASTTMIMTMLKRNDSVPRTLFNYRCGRLVAVEQNRGLSFHKFSETTLCYIQQHANDPCWRWSAYRSCVFESLKLETRSKNTDDWRHVYVVIWSEKCMPYNCNIHIRIIITFSPYCYIFTVDVSYRSWQ